MDPRSSPTNNPSRPAVTPCPPGITDVGVEALHEKNRPEQQRQERPTSSMSSTGGDVTRDAKQMTRDAKQMTRDAKQGAKQSVDHARAAGADLAHEVRRAASAYAHTAKVRGQEMIEGQKHRVADQLHTVGEAVHRAAGKFREEHDDNIAGYVDAVAEEVDRFADYLERRDPQHLVRDAQQFARREPEWFLGGMFLAGLALTRFLKASGRGDGDDEERSYAPPHARGRGQLAAQDEPWAPERPVTSAPITTNQPAIPMPAPTPAPGAQAAEVRHHGQ